MPGMPPRLACGPRSTASTCQPSITIRTRLSTGCGRACRARWPVGRSRSSTATAGWYRQRPSPSAMRATRARTLPGLQIDGQRVITSDHALGLDRVPASAVILGGGVIGVEFASVWRSFGAEVTIVEMLPHLLPMEDEASSKLLERAFRRRGIGYHLGVRFESVKETAT